MNFISRSSLSNNGWTFGQVPPQSFQASSVDDIALVTTWHPATVPGNVRADLLNNGLIPDPLIRQQFLKSRWVDAVDWWYQTTVKVDLSPGQRLFVCFHGLDYLSAIFVNGQEVSRHEGMFSRQLIELTDSLSEEECHLAVRFWGSDRLPRRKLSPGQQAWGRLAQQVQRSWAGVYPDRTATLKSQFSFGWDFTPPVRTIGIWDEVTLICTGPTLIEDCRIDIDTSGDGFVYLTLNGSQPPESVTLHVVPDNFAGSDDTNTIDWESLESTEVASTIEGWQGPPARCFKIPLTVPNPRLWHPWDRGQPNLYNLQIELPGSDQLTKRFGLRSVTWHNWRLTHNQQNTFIRGLNWVPADIFPGRVTIDDYRTLLTLVKETGANALRVWGGGLREKQAFYDLCDELGLLVWQEFPFACVFLGAYPRDETFLDLVAQEADEIVRQLHHHPSLMLWCGGNEFSPSRNRPLLQRLESAVAKSTSIPFSPVSPSQGEAHNWDVWHGQRPIASYRQDMTLFMSEFGLQALPDQETLTTVLVTPDQNWESRLGDSPKLLRYLLPFLDDFDRDRDSEDKAQQLSTTSLASLIDASQRAQAAGLQTAIEHMRRRKAQAGGVIAWQFNEPWPAISWAILDYYRRPKLAYKRLKLWYQPVLICLDLEPGQNWQPGQQLEAMLCGINDSLESVSGTVRVALDGVAIFEIAQVLLPPDSAIQLGMISYRLETKPKQLSLTLQQGQTEMARNVYDLTWQDEAAPDWLSRIRRLGATLALK